jgi:Domain of unknown function (DUF4166)
MRAPAVAAELLPTPETKPGPQPRPEPRVELGDLRFRALMSEEAWASLPLAIRRRFSKRLAAGQTIVYTGHILESRMSRAGWWLVQAARLIGAPLPLARDSNDRSARVPIVHLASVVAVTEDMATGGQIWSRLYACRKGFPQAIHSAKRFAGPTGLEEYVGWGVGMTLTVHAHEGALVFRSENYFVEIFGRRFYLPEWLTPGTLYVTHAELPDEKFSFTLQIFHPRFGLLLRQMAIFRETAP